MSILRYSEFLNENTNLYEKEISLIEDHYLLLRSQGMNESEINENIFSSLLSSLGGGFGDTMKNYIVDWAAEKLGINPFDELGRPTFFYQVIRNVVEEVSFTQLGSYFGKDSCKNWSKAIVKAMAETIEERGIDYLLPALGVNINMNTGLGGTIAASVREALTNAINNTEFADKIEKSISDKICGFNFGDILSGKLSSGDKEKIQSSVEAAGEKNPDVFAKAMKSGLTNILQF